MSAARGNRGEAAVLNALVGRGLNVLIPFGEGQPYDLAIDLGDVFLRIQCKTGWAKGGCVLFNSHATDHGSGALSYHGRADVFGVFFPSDHTVYLVPIADVGRLEGRLRLEPTRNNQRRRVRLACEYEIDRWPLERLRAVVSRAAAA